MTDTTSSPRSRIGAARSASDRALTEGQEDIAGSSAPQRLGPSVDGANDAVADQADVDQADVDQAGAEQADQDPPTCMVIGAGLIGTSIALALSDRGWPVFLDDLDPPSVQLAADLGGGRPLEALRAVGDVDVVVVAVPPARTPAVIADSLRRYVNATVTDVASIKTQPQVQVQALKADLTRYCGGHPVAGRERSGPAAARHDLFVGLPWVVCPGPTTSSAATAAVTELAVACLAQPVLMDPALHDEALAAVSHLPQLVASATAAALHDVPDTALALSGRGLADTTRIAASDPALWVEIVTGNATAVAPLLDEVVRRLVEVRDALAGTAEDQASQVSQVSVTIRGRRQAQVVERLVRDGNVAVARLPGKHGRRVASYRVVPVLVGDTPGQLAGLFADVSVIGVNVEDVALEHAPGRPLGVAELSVQPEQEGLLREGLTARGWTVRTQPG